MIVETLKLEVIGDDAITSFSQMHRSFNNLYPHLGDKVIGKPFKSKPWVAEITGKDEKYKFKRTFLNGQKDYSEANSKGSRGVYLYFHLGGEKIYEIFEHLSWKKNDRYFIKTGSEEGYQCLTEKEVIKHLETLRNN